MGDAVATTRSTAKPEAANKSQKFRFGALLARGVNQHQQIEPFGRRCFVAFRHDVLGQQQSRGRDQRGTAPTQDRPRRLVRSSRG